MQLKGKGRGLSLPFLECHGHVSECPHCQIEGGVGVALPRSLPTGGKKEAKKAVRESTEEENPSLNVLKQGKSKEGKKYV